MNRLSSNLLCGLSSNLPISGQSKEQKCAVDAFVNIPCHPLRVNKNENQMNNRKQEYLKFTFSMKMLSSS